MLLNTSKGGRGRGSRLGEKDGGRKQICAFQALTLYPEDCPEVLGQMQQQQEEAHMRAGSDKGDRLTGESPSLLRCWNPCILLLLPWSHKETTCSAAHHLLSIVERELLAKPEPLPTRTPPSCSF